MNKDNVFSAIRSLLKVGGGFLISKGVTDSDGADAAGGAIVTLIGLIWSWLTHAKKPAPLGLFLGALILPGLLPLTGCVTGANVAKLAHELKNDHATVKANITTPWGTAVFERSNPLPETNAPVPAPTPK